MASLDKNNFPLKIFSYQTRFGAKIPLHEVYEQMINKDYGVVMSSERPGFVVPDHNYELYEDYIDCEGIQDICIHEGCNYTRWEKWAFEKFVRDISFSGSFLIWFGADLEDVSGFLFESRQWSQAIFGYDGVLFFEIYSKCELQKLHQHMIEIEYPGSINCPGGLSINT